ncbi:TerB family tellurite resistance protein [Halocynthiibacter namhaensis]|uniref:tellurite resistance TerB family protein n=1 Tax=Halocynthiibacter namhaensis TaxID=1290553 RepID=UPI000578E3F9|nr:TerB family tellurite resistance protein [Halocynthiibacter namhaensis]
MFADLLRRMTAPAPAPLSAPDARLALAALLVRVARSDGDYADSEAREITRRLADRYQLNESAALQLRHDAETLESEAPDTVRFTQAIKDAVKHEARLEIMETLWAIALADGERDAQEDTQLRLVANLLGLSDVDSAKARQRVQ